jgi:hypothetical protein
MRSLGATLRAAVEIRREVEGDICVSLAGSEAGWLAAPPPTGYVEDAACDLAAERAAAALAPLAPTRRAPRSERGGSARWQRRKACRCAVLGLGWRGIRLPPHMAASGETSTGPRTGGCHRTARHRPPRPSDRPVQKPSRSSSQGGTSRPRASPANARTRPQDPQG